MNEDKASRYHRLRRRSDVLGTVAGGRPPGRSSATGAHLRLREVGSIVGAIIGNGWEEPGTVVGTALALFLLLQLIELPFAFYQGYRLEHRYGLSTQRLGQWWADHAKGAALGGAFAIMAASLVYWAMRSAPTWWWALSAIAAVTALVGLVHLAPVLLLPLFYSFKPLDRPALVSRLLTLADRARTQVVGIYEWVLSAHTRKANAALTGMGRTRRILLSDTLLASYSDDEIEVVLAHELSHHVHHDLWRGMALQAAMIGAAFFAAHLALDAWAVRLRLGRHRRSGGSRPAAARRRRVFHCVAAADQCVVARARASRRSLRAGDHGPPGRVHLGDEAARAAESCRGVSLGHGPVVLLLASANSRARRCRPGLARGGDDA